MRIVMINGGLANQVFQYIFMRFGELVCPEEEWFLDDTEFWMGEKIHNGYELDKVFGLSPKLLSKQFDPDVWNEIIELRKKGYGIPQIFSDNGNTIDLVLSECDITSWDRPFEGLEVQLSTNQYNPRITAIKGHNVYYYGYWINKSWFDAAKSIFCKELSFPPLTDEKNLNYMKMITDSNSVAIHVRRGDFVDLQWSLNEAYYLDSSRKIMALVPDAHFFVFSDDIEWCKGHESECGFDLAPQLTYIEGNCKGKNYIDMQLMSCCKHDIMSLSAFCYLSVLLSKERDKVINPTRRQV